MPPRKSPELEADHCSEKFNYKETEDIECLNSITRVVRGNMNQPTITKAPDALSKRQIGSHVPASL